MKKSGAHIRLKDAQDEYIRLYAEKNGISISDAANQLIAVAAEQFEAGNTLNILSSGLKGIFQEVLGEFAEKTGDKITKRLAGIMALNTNYTLKGFWLTKDMLAKIMLLEKANWENLKNDALKEEVEKLVEELEKSSEGQMRAIYEKNRKKIEANNNNAPQQTE